MAPPQSAQKQMPVRRVGPLTTRAGVTSGLRAREMGLHGVEGGLVDQRRHDDVDHLAYRLQFLGFAALVELVTPGIGLAGQDAVNLPDAPSPAAEAPGST
jgi:hypothetical protein